MAKVAKKIEIQDQIDMELLARSKTALEKRGYDFSRLDDTDIIQTAKLVCDVQAELDIEAQQKTAKELESRLKKETVKDFKALASEISDLVRSEIGPNPTKSYNSSIGLGSGDNILIGITAYQEVDETVKKNKTHKREIQAKLNSLAEGMGLKTLKKVLKVKRGTKDRFSFGVYPKKIKVDDLEFQLTLGYEVKKEEE